MGPTGTFQRARRPEQKTQRYEAILDAAAVLARRDGVRAVSLADIAATVGVHKSALLRYFETREQIFLELTARAWREWADALETMLIAPPAGRDAVAAVLATSFTDRPLLCELIAHVALNLERNVSVNAVRAYKLVSLGSVRRAAHAVHAAVAELTETDCGELISVLASQVGALWQIATPPAPLAALYASDPELSGACVDLTPRLTRTASVLIAGLTALRSSPPRR